MNAPVSQNLCLLNSPVPGKKKSALPGAASLSNQAKSSTSERPESDEERTSPNSRKNILVFENLMQTKPSRKNSSAEQMHIANLVFPSILKTAIRKHAEQSYPQECCGFLIGARRRLSFELIHEVPARNASAGEKTKRFLISPTEYLAAEKSAEAKNLEIIGFYHSHPNSRARPSQLDLEHAWPNMIYLIASVNDGKIGEFGAFLLAENRKEFLPVAIHDDL